MPIQLPDLPYALDALEPHLSARTLEFHYRNHHQAYVDNLNAAINDSCYANETLEHILVSAFKKEDTNVFNNAAQVWNHAFQWQSLSPDGGGPPDGTLGKLIQQSFGGFDEFCSAFRDAATSRFGSGWAWLVADGANLRIVTTANADNPVLAGLRPLMTLDLWEHAYYLDYQDRRGDYVDRFLARLINWRFAAANFEAGRAAA